MGGQQSPPAEEERQGASEPAPETGVVEVAAGAAAAEAEAGAALLEVQVLGLAGQLCSFIAEGAWSLGRVKKAIAKQTGVPAWEQTLIFGVQELNYSKKGLGFADTLASSGWDAALLPSVGSGPPSVQLMMLRRAEDHAAIGWQVRHSADAIVLRHAASGFVVELIGRSNGWFRVSDGQGTNKIVWTNSTVSDQHLFDSSWRLAKKAAKGRPLPWLERDAEQALTMGKWTVAVARVGGPMHLAVSHAGEGDMLQLLPQDLVFRAVSQSAVQDLFHDCQDRVTA